MICPWAKHYSHTKSISTGNAEKSFKTRLQCENLISDNFRVKRCEVSASCPNIFWSASEDGTIMETDIRAPEEEVGILINLSADAGPGIEAKCLSVNPIFNEYLAVGASDAFIRMYDRRQMKYNVMKVWYTVWKIQNFSVI